MSQAVPERAERRIPGLWEMDIDEIAERAREDLPPWAEALRAGKSLVLEDGRWVGSVHMGYEPGRRVRKHVFGKTRAEVAEKVKPLLKAKDEQRPVPDQRLTVGAYLRTWLEDVAKPTIRVSTYHSYYDIVELHLIPDLGRIRLARLSPTDVQAFLTKKQASGLSARRVQMLHAVLRRVIPRRRSC